MMIKPALCFASLLCAALPAVADVPQAARALRQGMPDQALAALDNEDDSPAAFYWRGRALIALGRLEQAAAQLRRVPQESPCHPYAARGLLYCAWQSPSLNFVEIVAPLTTSPDAEVSALALAALAERQLRNTAKGDASALEDLRKLAKPGSKLESVVRLLDIESLRRSGKYAQAIAACAEMEADKSLPLLMRQRVRLALAEVFYDKAAAPAPLNTEEDTEDDEGKGEETLLQFISSNPDSPLLDEAFRRLETRHAFASSKYAGQKLQEWSEEFSKPHRAALALKIRQYLQLQMGASPEDVQPFANTASAMLPNEPVTNLIISEQVRHMIARGDIGGAELYLSLQKDREDDARSLFYKACCLQASDPKAAELFARSATLADSDLQAAALANTIYCAAQNGDQATVDRLLADELPNRSRRAILLMHAGLILQSNPAQARAEIESALLLRPTTEQKAEALLQLAQLDIAEKKPAEAAQRLQEAPTELFEVWTDAQALRFYGLKILAAEKLHGQDGTAGSPEETTRECLKMAKSQEVRTSLALNLANRLSTGGRHHEALDLLADLAAGLPSGEEKARALLLAGRESAALGSLNGLKKAIAYFQSCAEIPSAYNRRARILQAAILAWINRIDEALPIISSLLHNKTEPLSSTDLALAYSVQADIFSLQGTPESQKLALAANENIRQIKNLPENWQLRATLQHATIAARASEREQALEDYLKIIAGKPASSPSPHKAEWHVLYYAGSGAICQYLQLQRYEEAALLAEKLAAWPNPDAAPGPRAEQFAQWGANIRKTHFLPHASQGGNF